MIDPGWIFGAIGVASAAVSFWRGRRMGEQLKRIERLLADRARDHPETVVRRAAEVDPDVAKAMEDRFVPWVEATRRHLEQVPEREAAMVQLWAEGAEPSEIAEAFKVTHEWVDQAIRGAGSRIVQPPPQAASDSVGEE